MTRVFRQALPVLAGPSTTMAGFAALAAAVVGAHVDGRLPTAVVAVPLALLALNLAAALALHPALRRGGLAVFHIALLGCLLLAAAGRLLHLEGRLELAEGQAFDPRAVVVGSQGPWLGDKLARLRFTQGPFQVRYAPGLQRSHTTSLVEAGEGGWRAVGDDEPLVLSGVRFYTTHNKGFAPVFTWRAPGAAPVRGALHLPSYPLFDWKQQQRWSAPGGPVVQVALRLHAPPSEREAWALRPDAHDHHLVIEVAGERHEVPPGGRIEGPWGMLHYERMSGWMGYRLHYDPVMQPLFWLALLGAAGLAAHLWPRARREAAPWLQPRTSP